MENTVLFGNGINRLNSNNISWDDILNNIKGSKKFDHKDLPNTMVYERVILNTPRLHKDILFDEFKVKEKIAALLGKIGQNSLYSDIFDSNIQNYITTNYDYSFLDSVIERQDVNTPIQDYGPEDIYSIRRLKIISNTSESKKHFWQIHGEIRKPATIMLGLDHYCGSVGKINEYIKGTYKYTVDKEEIRENSITDKFHDNSFSGSSWIELFFTSNVYIFGITLEYVEIDLWWIINKRARMKKSNLQGLIKNKITIYISAKDEKKIGLLQSMDVTVELIKVADNENKYREYFDKVIKKLKKDL